MNGAGRSEARGGGNQPRLRLAWEIGRYKDAAPRKRSWAARRSYRAAALFVCVAAIVMVSSAVVSFGNATETAARQPIPPYNVQGYVYQSDGTTPAVDCTVNVTNVATGEWLLTATDPVYGWYELDLANMLPSGVADGQVINVTVTKDLSIGWGEGTAMPGSTPYLELNIVMNGTIIPEFPMVVLPVVGLMALFVVVGLVRRKNAS